jgi:hypothetical protein
MVRVHLGSLSFSPLLASLFVAASASSLPRTGSTRLLLVVALLD